MAGFFFLNESTGRRYDVINIDKAAGKITLRGRTTGREFTETFDPEKFAKMGYKLMQEV